MPPGLVESSSAWDGVTFGIAMDESGSLPWVYFGLLKAFLYCLGQMGFEYLIIIFFCGLGTAIIGKAKGSSFWIWFLVGAVLPILGLIAVVLYRRVWSSRARPGWG